MARYTTFRPLGLYQVCGIRTSSHALHNGYRSAETGDERDRTLEHNRYLVHVHARTALASHAPAPCVLLFGDSSCPHSLSARGFTLCELTLPPPFPQYPHGIRDIEFNPKFAIRGLHCDTTEGLLMKIDAYNHIQLGSVYR